MKQSTQIGKLDETRTVGSIMQRTKQQNRNRLHRTTVASGLAPLTSPNSQDNDPDLTLALALQPRRHQIWPLIK